MKLAPSPIRFARGLRVIALLAAAVSLNLSVLIAADAASPTREVLSLDQGWRYHLGDIPFPIIKGHDSSYSNAKAGKAWGAAAPEYDDSGWRELNLPHDWAVEGPFDPDANLSQGYRPRGIGWYRRQFRLPTADRGKHLELRFDGIATHATIWFNGTVVHRNWCGYTSAYVDVTPLANYGDGVNTIAIRVDADAMEGWWYEGAGLYRHAWLVKRAPLHLVTDGVFAHPVRDAAGAWTIPVETTLNNSGRDAAPAEVEVTVSDPAGNPVAQDRGTAKVDPVGDAVVTFTIPVPSPRLWSVDNPVLYQVKTVVKRDNKPVDETTTSCGFRTVRFDPDKGFFLNDQPLKLQGTCNHQDHAGVGVAVPDALWDFRVRRLKEMGSNAYRCAHNPPAREFLEACDRLGMLVMDENRNFNTTPETIRQLEWLVRRDRNHPSVILWSVFNEEPVQGTEVGFEMVRRLTAVVKRLDATRPVTAAQSGGNLNPVNASQAADVAGFNYQQGQYDKFHAENPTRPLTSSEDTSAFMVRDEYVNDGNRHLRGSYDTERANWGATHRDGWRQIAERPFVAGGFVWTGFDYRGEPTPYTWPTAGSLFGCMDQCGFPKMAFFLHQAQWVHDRPVLHLVPHWNWPDKVGKPVKVMALTNADAVALSLNGQPLGKKPVDKYEMVSWDVPYAPGKLEAVAMKGGKEIARTVVETTGEPVSLRLTADRPTLAGDGWDASVVTVEALDARGRPVTLANQNVEFEAVGPAAIIGLGNGDPNSHEPEKGNLRSLFNGLAQVVLQSAANGSGPFTLRARAEGLKPAETVIQVNAAASRPFVPTHQPVSTLDRWRVSPGSPTRPDPNQEVADNDMNSWTPVTVGKLQAPAGGEFAIYRTKVTPRANVRKSGGQLVFKNLVGKAEVWVDGALLGKKESRPAGELRVPCPPGEGERKVSVLVEAPAGQPAGLGGVVTLLGPNATNGVPRPGRTSER